MIRVSCIEGTSTEAWGWQLTRLYLIQSYWLHGALPPIALMPSWPSTEKQGPLYLHIFLNLQACEYLPRYLIKCMAQKTSDSQQLLGQSRSPCILWEWRSVTEFTIFRHCLYPRPYQWSHHPTVVFILTSILMLYSHLHVGLKSCLFPSDFVTNTLYIFLLVMLAIHPTYEMIYIFNRNWVDTRCQQYITHLHTLHTNNTHNTEKGKLGVVCCNIILRKVIGGPCGQFPWELFNLSLIYLFV
jgi:hypothetical protein